MRKLRPLLLATASLLAIIALGFIVSLLFAIFTGYLGDAGIGSTVRIIVSAFANTAEYFFAGLILDGVGLIIYFETTKMVEWRIRFFGAGAVAVSTAVFAVLVGKLFPTDAVVVMLWVFGVIFLDSLANRIWGEAEDANVHMPPTA